MEPEVLMEGKCRRRRKETLIQLNLSSAEYQSLLTSSPTQALTPQQPTLCSPPLFRNLSYAKINRPRFERARQTRFCSRRLQCPAGGKRRENGDHRCDPYRRDFADASPAD